MNKPEKINIAIVDDAQLTLNGWIETFKDHPEINIVFTALNKESFWRKCEEYRDSIDVLVLDKNIDGKTQFNDFTFIEETRNKFPNHKIIVYTWDYYTGHINHLRRIKVNGYLPNKAGETEMLEGIRSVMNGLPYFPNDEKTQSADKSGYGSGSEFDYEFIKLVCDLSLVQSKIAACLAYDLQNKQIAEKLVCNLKTIEKHISLIYNQLGIPARKVHARSMFNRHYGEYFRQKYPDLLKK